MKGFEWLLEEPDLNRLAEDGDYNKICLHPCDRFETLMEVVARFASLYDKIELLKFILDNGYAIDAEIGVRNGTVLDRVETYECQRYLIDRGATTSHTNLLARSLDFIESRNRARSYAILVMYAMYKMDKTYKNVSVIIGRVIWASRSDSENWVDWLN